MIILRQKQYSLAPTRFLAGFNKTVRRMSPYQAKRAALGTERKAFEGIVKTRNSINNIVTNPGGNVARPMVKGIVEAPVTGTATALVPGGSVIQATPLPKLETKALDKIGAGKYTKRAANWVDRKIGPAIEEGVNSGFRYIQAISH